ncbi:MAG TPA: carbon monoxide dehydrogenase [Syntrophobacteraceae bacterium]|nr:carbon monoxide dehydrogenase [Syntrophobacteraceae bacterium]
MRPTHYAVGCRVPRFDATAKVTGQERYAIDHYPEGLLWAGVKRAGVPHGIIRGLEVDVARKLDGVMVVLTAADVPGTNRQGIVHKDQPVLADEKVRHCGDAVALVVTENREVLRQALDSIQVDIEPLPGVFSPLAAMQTDAPRVHENGNVLLHAVIGAGNGAAALAECAVVVEDRFEVPCQCHAFLETENGVAWQEPDGRIVLMVSTQAPFRDRFEIAHALGLEVNRLRVISPYLGGGFGGKDGATVQCFLALAAMHTGGRPVKMVWDREESFLAGYKRHPVQMEYRLGAKMDGTLHALQCRLVYDTGAYAHLGGEVLELGMEHAGGPYRIPNTHIEGWCVYTNNPISGAMRGFGVCQVSFAFERMIDLLAQRLAIDPLELRIRNALRQGDRNCAGVTLVHSTGILPCLETLSRHPLWLDRDAWKQAAGPFKQRGVGIAAVFNAMGYGRGLPDSAIARVELTEKGNFRVFSGVSDMGQGNAATFVQIAGEILCQDESRMELIQPDTDRSHPSGSSSASRTTYTYGNALIQACQELKRKLLHRAQLLLMADEDRGLVLVPGRVRHLPSGHEVPLEGLAAIMPDSDRVGMSQFVMPVSQDVPDTGKEFVIGFPHALFSYGAQLVYVEVDQLTGKIDVCQVLAVTEAGRVINPQCFEQQVQGAVAQGIGYAVCEEVAVRDGVILTPDFTNYVLPTALDVPEMESLTVETVEPTGPFGMKGVGEVGVNAPLPAIASGVEDALGLRITRSPMTAERVFQALQER